MGLILELIKTWNKNLQGYIYIFYSFSLAELRWLNRSIFIRKNLKKNISIFFYLAKRFFSHISSLVSVQLSLKYTIALLRVLIITKCPVEI